MAKDNNAVQRRAPNTPSAIKMNWRYSCHGFSQQPRTDHRRTPRQPRNCGS